MVLLQRRLKKKKKNEYLFFNFKTIYMKYENIIINYKTLTYGEHADGPRAPHSS
jgi:hypothetical protein